MTTILGYTRASTGDQDVAGQTIRLDYAGAVKVFTDVMSGKSMDGAGLAELLAYALRKQNPVSSKPSDICHAIRTVTRVSEPELITDLDALVVSALAVGSAANAHQLYLAGLSSEHRARVEKYLAKATADATLRAYRSNWQMFAPGA